MSLNIKMSRLDYSSANMENFAINAISKSYDNSYASYIWHDKDDDFDFTSSDDSTALEIATILPSNIINAIKYEKALDNGKNPDAQKVISACTDKYGELLIYYGGSMEEIREAAIKMINKKEEKRKKRLKKYKRYELCLCIDEGSLLNAPSNFEFIINNGILDKTGFSRLFLITCSKFYVIEKNKINEYERIA